jgi:hypothetical protein
MLVLKSCLHGHGAMSSLYSFVPFVLHFRPSTAAQIMANEFSNLQSLT